MICVDTKKVPAHFAGRNYDEALLHELPNAVDPCGENGEFHTFVFGGPVFQKPIAVGFGDRVSKQGFEFLDLLPTSAS